MWREVDHELQGVSVEPGLSYLLEEMQGFLGTHEAVVDSVTPLRRDIIVLIIAVKMLIVW